MPDWMRWPDLLAFTVVAVIVIFGVGAHVAGVF